MAMGKKRLAVVVMTLVVLKRAASSARMSWALQKSMVALPALSLAYSVKGSGGLSATVA